MSSSYLKKGTTPNHAVITATSSEPSLEENESDMKNLKQIYFVSPQDLYKEMFSLLFKILLKD